VINSLYGLFQVPAKPQEEICREQKSVPFTVPVYRVASHETTKLFRYGRETAQIGGMGGAACQTRTDDPIITNDVLYQLS
jgi:hypothetical protein